VQLPPIVVLWGRLIALPPRVLHGIMYLLGGVSKFLILLEVVGILLSGIACHYKKCSNPRTHIALPLLPFSFMMVLMRRYKKIRRVTWNCILAFEKMRIDKKDTRHIQLYFIQL